MKVLYRGIIVFLLLTWTLSSSAQGLKLFSPEIHDAAAYPQRVVMDFLERYFNIDLPNQRQTTREHKMADDKVYFRKGKPADLYQVTDSMPFSINLLDRYYEIQWMKNEEPIITLVFPAQYDLLMGMQQNESQLKLKERILAAPERQDSIEEPVNLTILEDSIYMMKTDMFELESLNDATYYNKVREDYIPVFNDSLLDYSAANLFHGLIADANYRMYIEQSVYGMKTINYSITLKQWLNYCSRCNMKIFFAVEEEREDGFLAIVVAQCKELGFNHLLSVVIPDKFVNDQNAVLKVRLTPYIPTHNVKTLYQQETENHKKVIWQ
jgi:hypothetical protein